MADAFENLKSAWNRGITTISIKTSSSLEKSKIKTHIDSLTRETEREYQSLGEAAYKIWVTDSVDFSALHDRFVSIKRKQDEITQLNMELAAIDERDNQILGTATEEKVAPKFVCSNCGARYETAAKFCRRCGNKMTE